jgi:asparagine synthase (glutamine-hydrolysing)
MCGFLVEFSENIDVNRWNSAFHAIGHRGPDYSGDYFGEASAWGHHRLSIIDLGESSNQPMVKDKSRLVYNGEIYNYESLGREILNREYSSDTKFLFDYLNEGYRDFESFKGFWAFVYQDQAGKILACRDKLGIKPLYFFQDKSTLVFGSEVKALLPYLKDIKLNKELIDPYLNDGGVDGLRRTLLEGIFQVKQGTFLYDGLETRYFSLSRKKKTSGIDWHSEVRDAVDYATVADVPLALSLSSGIDSNLVNCYSDISTAFTAGSTKRSLIDEYTAVQQVCNERKQVLRVVDVSEKYSYKDIEKSLEIVDFPSWSLNPTFYSNYYAEVRKAGFKVLLEGHGVDEYLGGYQKHLYDFLYDAFLRFDLEGVKTAYHIIKEANNSAYNSEHRPLWQYSAKVILNFFGIEPLSNSEKRVLSLRGRRIVFPIKLIRPFLIKRSKYYRKIDIEEKIIPTVLRVFDRVTMYNGLEMRPPLLDDQLVVSGFNSTYKQLVTEMGQKAPFRKLLKRNEYPNVIVDQKKKYGFSADLHYLLVAASECLEKVDISVYNYLQIDLHKVQKLYKDYCDTLDWQKGETLSRIFSLVIWYSNICENKNG